VPGLSWTLNKDKALFFARRFKPPQPILATALLRKRDVLAYLPDRDEEEIVCLPTAVRDVRLEHISAKPLGKI
jgi:hypothetical protein